MTDTDLHHGDDDLVDALLHLGDGLDVPATRGLDEVRTRGRRRRVRDRAVVGGGTLALALVVVAGVQQLRPVGSPTIADVTGTTAEEAVDGAVDGDPAPDEPAPDEPAVEPAPAVPPLPVPALPEPAGDDVVDLRELRAWYDLYWEQVDVGASYGIGDGAGLYLALGIEVLAGEPDPRATDVLGDLAARDALADEVAGYRASGLDPTTGFLLEAPELADVLRRLETTLRALDGDGPATTPAPAGEAGVDVEELQRWSLLARDGLLDDTTTALVDRSVALFTAVGWEPPVLDALVDDALAAVAEDLPTMDPAVRDLRERLLDTLAREQAAGPVPTTAPVAAAGDALTPEQVRDWTRLYWTQAGAPDGVVSADGVGRLLSLTHELLAGAPDPRDEGFWSADAGIGADALLVDARSYLERGTGADGFLAGRPDLVDLVERLVATLEDLAAV